MYQEFYGLNENPFRLTPDPQYLFHTRNHKEAMAQLFYGVSERKGFIVLIGEVGMGKTLLLNWMMETLSENEIPSSYIFNSVMNATDMFEYISADFDLQCNAGSKNQFLAQLHNLLIKLYTQGKTAVLIVDEAQNLSLEVLEELRMLSNLETGKEKLLQIILAGQPELAQKLDHPSMRQLKQRVALRCTLKPLNFNEVKEYVQSRLKIAGLEGESPFDQSALKAIHELSNGIPRIINNICDNALLSGFARAQTTIDRAMIEEIGEDLQLKTTSTTIPNGPINGANVAKALKPLPAQLGFHITPALGWKIYLTNLLRRFTQPMSRKVRG